MFSIEIPHTVLELHRFCSTDESRESLTRIYVSPTIQVATDGHVLATCKSELNASLGAKDVVYIPAKVAKAALVGFKRGSPYFYQVRCDHAGKAIDLVVHAGVMDGPVIATHAIDPDTQVSAYPDFDLVIPKEDKISPVKEIGLDLKLLGVFHAFLKRLGETGGCLFRFTDSLGPAISSRTLSDGTEVSFIIMPMNI
jgi:hypothetical protein